MPEYSRAERVADQIQKELSSLIQREMKDPRLNMVTINAVEVSRDLAFADAYITSLGRDIEDKAAQQESVNVLNGAAGFLRSRLAKLIKLRAVPTLRFHYDVSVERGRHLSSLIDQAVAKDQG